VFIIEPVLEKNRRDPGEKQTPPVRARRRVRSILPTALGARSQRPGGQVGLEPLTRPEAKLRLQYIKNCQK
jgi:hypothetical protein